MNNILLDRSKPPKAAKAKDVKFPEYFEKKFDNGIKLFVIEDNRLPLVTTRFVFGSGARDDNYRGEELSGLSSFTAELLTKGTHSYDAIQIAEIIDFHGATLNSGCEYDASFINATSLKKFFDKIFNITSELIIDSVFSEQEIERQRLQILNSLLAYLDEGEFLSERIFKKAVYGNSSYSYNIEGTESSVKRITREDLLIYYNSFYTSNNLMIALVGDIKAEYAVSLIEKTFSGYKNNKNIITDYKIPDINDSVKIKVIEKKGAVQSDIKLGHLSVPRNNPDYIPLSVMNTLLGGYFTSRINKNLREVNGYTYGARSYFSYKKNTGDFCVETNVKNELTGDAIKEIIKELNDIRDFKITDEELNSVKNYLAGNFPLQLETPNSIATKVLNMELYNIEKDFYNTYITKVNNVTKEEIKFVAEKYIHPDKLTIAIAGNTNDITNSVKDLGKSEIIKLEE